MDKDGVKQEKEKRETEPTRLKIEKDFQIAKLKKPKDKASIVLTREKTIKTRKGGQEINKHREKKENTRSPRRDGGRAAVNRDRQSFTVAPQK